VVTATEAERVILRRILAKIGDPMNASASIEVCGFGLIAAAIGTMRLVEAYRPTRLVLIGIAGTFDETEFPIGSARRFGRVLIDGVGVGEGDAFQSAGQLGWGGDEGIELPGDGLLLSVTSASSDAAMADRRRRRFSGLVGQGGAIAEEMEGYAVAAACKTAGIRCEVVRGASNRVGDRDHANWKIDAALAAAWRLCVELNEVWA